MRSSPVNNARNIFLGVLGRNGGYMGPARHQHLSSSTELFFLDHPFLPPSYKFSRFRVTDQNMKNLRFERRSKTSWTNEESLLAWIKKQTQPQENIKLAVMRTPSLRQLDDDARVCLVIQPSPVLDTLSHGRYSTFVERGVQQSGRHLVLYSRKAREPNVKRGNLRAFTDIYWVENDIKNICIEQERIASVICPTSNLGVELWLRGLDVICHEDSYLYGVQEFAKNARINDRGDAYLSYLGDTALTISELAEARLIEAEI